MRRSSASLLSLVLFLPAISEATQVLTDESTGVRIDYEGPLLASRSHTFLSVTIGNDSGRTRAWVLDFDGARYGNQGGRRTSRFELEVADGEERTFELLVPVHDEGASNWVQMRVYGYGVRGQVYSIGGPVGAQVGISTTLGQGDEAPALARLSGTFGPVVPKDFPSDGRAFVGFETLWLAETDWKSLALGPKRGIHEWVARGGKLVVVGADHDVTPLGLGTIVTLPVESVGTESPHARDVLVAGGENTAGWARRFLEPIEMHAGLLSLVLLGYVALVAPVNLLLFAPSGKRVRLYWTMPSIALGASVSLAAIIVLQDGVGGSGERVDFIFLMPEIHRELLVQEQASRTGALLQKSFELEDDVLLLDRSGAAERSSRVLRSASASYSGDWFQSRSIQAHRLERWRPSRAHIERADRDGAPAVLSSIDERLTELYYRDGEGRCWRAVNVVPGRTVELSSVTDAEFTEWKRATLAGIAPRIARHVETVFHRRGSFLAAADPQTSRTPIETLGNIQWRQRAVLYAGRIEER